MVHLTLSCSCTTQQQHSNKKRKQGQEEETQQQIKNVVRTNWDVYDYNLPLKKRKIKNEKSDLSSNTNNNDDDDDDIVWRNWEDWEYDLPIKKRKIKGRTWGYCEYDLPLKKRKIRMEKSDLDYNNNNNNNNNVSSSTSHDDTKIANKEETKKTCNVDDEWEIKKVLEWSDVCRAASRLLVKKELTQEFVIPVVLGGAKAAQEKGVEVQVWDVDTKSLHSLVFKIWTSTQGHVFNKRWVKDFVLRRELKKGDQIGLHWDQDNGRFNFSVISL